MSNFPFDIVWRLFRIVKIFKKIKLSKFLSHSAIFPVAAAKVIFPESKLISPVFVKSKWHSRPRFKIVYHMPP